MRGRPHHSDTKDGKDAGGAQMPDLFDGAPDGESEAAPEKIDTEAPEGESAADEAVPGKRDI